MKKSIGISLVASVMLCGASLYAVAAPPKGARAAFGKGDNTLGLSLGVGNVYTYHGGSTYLPAIAVNFDHGLVGNVGPGTIGIGGIIGWQNTYYKYGNGDRVSWTNFIMGFRGTYHLTILKDKNNKFDPYGGVTVGIRVESYNGNHNGTYDVDGNAHPFVGPFVGAKYNFTPKFGAFSELGYDISLFRIGLHLNF